MKEFLCSVDVEFEVDETTVFATTTFKVGSDHFGEALDLARGIAVALVGAARVKGASVSGLECIDPARGIRT